MYFSLLGALQVRSDGTDVPIRGTLRRTLLAALLLNHDRVVSASSLSDLLWRGDATPLYNQVMRLRQALGDDGGLIRAVPPGYSIHVPPTDLDLTEFTDLCTRARDAAAAGDWLSSSKLYAAALALWRGEMLADVPALHDHPAIHQYTEDRLLALQGRIEADLNLARHDELIGELRTLVASHPSREAFHAQLMLALYRAGRQTDALNVYRDLRRTLVTELAIEPGPAIQTLRKDILNASPALTLEPPPPAPRPSIPAPRQLPADTRLFTGRRVELDELTSLALNGGSDSGAVVISAINGMGGVGKTALAVRAAHQLRERYPDGQLFIDLHGYAADLDPVAPEDALDYLLRSLGVPPQSIPGDLEARTTLYRSKLAGTRTLILLDNAADATQVRPLLPAATGCLVLVTSRNRLTSLDGAHLLALDVLPHADAVALLREVAGPGRAAELDARSDAVAELITLCARTPLAIRIVAARLRHRSSLTVETLNAELREEANRVDRIQDGDRDLTSVFDSSLRTIPEPAQRLFRLLGLVPGPDFDPYAAAHLTATDLRTAEHHLETLLDHNLLIQNAPTRYRLHDLLRAHARTLAAQDPHAPAALDRLIDFCVATACAADSLPSKRLTRPHHFRVPEAADPGVEFADRSSAQAWLRIERPGLLALIESPETDRVRREALIEAMTAFHGAEGPWNVAARLQTVLITSARKRNDSVSEANALSELGRLEENLGKTEDAERHLSDALAIYRDLGDARGEADTLQAIGTNHFRRGVYHLAAEPFQQAAAVFRRIGPPARTASIAFWLGTIAHGSGNNETACTYFDEAIALYQESETPLGEVNVYLVKSRSAYALGDFDSVIPMLDKGLDLARQTMNKLGIANYVQEIARQKLLIGEYTEAGQLLDEALAIQQEIGFRIGEGNVYWERGRIAVAHGRRHEAMEWFTRSLDIFVGIGARSNEAVAQHEIAKLHQAAGEADLVEPLLIRALGMHKDGGYLVGEAEVRNSIAAYRAEAEGAEAGLALYRDAAEFADRAEHPLEKARALEGMARCEVRLGRVEAGVEHLRAAVDLYGRMKVVEYGPAAAWLGELTAGSAAAAASGE
jgi:DNA-binding SARP family transcriptional activator